VKTATILFGIASMFVASMLLHAPTSAVATYGGGNIQSYASDASLSNGTIVQLAGQDSGRVSIASQDNLGGMFGVTIDRNQLSVRMSNEALQNETYVASSGTYNVLVSTQAGAIATGDYLTLSSIDGVAMKAGTEQKTVFGRAAQPFDGKGVALGSTTLKDSRGNDNKKVILGAVSVTIDIRGNPNERSTKANVPEQLERVGEAIAEKEVSPIRIYLSIAITVICLIAAIAVLYGGVRSGVISIGRNPMSKKSIFRALFEVILTSLLIVIVGLFAVYLLLKL